MVRILGLVDWARANDSEPNMRADLVDGHQAIWQSRPLEDMRDAGFSRSQQRDIASYSVFVSNS
jgi:hypothetical protein